MFLFFDDTQTLPMDKDLIKNLLAQVGSGKLPLALEMIIGGIGECGQVWKQYGFSGDTSGWEDYSRFTIRHYNYYIVDCALSQKLFDGPEAVDLSGPLSQLGNIIEVELNASVVQALRKLKGIQMPKFWNRCDIEAGPCTLKTKKVIVHLNEWVKEGTDKLKALSLGQTANALEVAIKDQITDSELIPQALLNKEFVEDIKTFGEYRNNAAHPGSIDKTAFDQAYNLFIKIIKEYMPAMIELKGKLKP